MLSLLFVVAFVTVVVVVPIYVAAKLVGAKNVGFGSSFLAALLTGLLTGTTQTVAGQDSTIGGFIQFLGCGAIYAYVLGTSFVRGLIISVLVIGLTIGIILLMGGTIQAVGG